MTDKEYLRSRWFDRLVSCLVPEKDLYYELLMEVEMKYNNETRHETARRLIREAQSRSCIGQAVKEKSSYPSIRGNYSGSQIF